MGDRVVGVCGSAVQAVCLGFGCWGWAGPGCSDLVLAFSVVCGLGPQSCLEWLWCFVIGIVLRGIGISLLVLLCVFGVSGSLVSVVWWDVFLHLW
jgi:hypothetical protein